MSVSAWTGPIITWGNHATQSNPQAAPNVSFLGHALLDSRKPYTYYPGGAVTNAFYGYAANECVCIDQVPSAISANNLATSQSPGSAAITLTAGTGVTGSVSITTWNGTTATGLFALDGAMGSVAFGQDGTVALWDPTKALSRNIRITSGGNDTGITFLVVGYDIYGQAMSEAITGANVGVASGVKAWKYIQSITPSGAVASTVTVGTGDVYGLPLRADYFAYTGIVWNNSWITASTGFTAAVLTSPATTTTGDVRGTYAVQSASDGTKRLQVFITPSVLAMSNSNIQSISAAGIWGVYQNLQTTL